MSFIYWLSKFSREAITIELFSISLVCTTYFGYLLIQKRRWGAATNKSVPTDVVKAFLIELISNAEGFKNQLFGENLKIPKGSVEHVPVVQAPALAPASAEGSSDADLEEIKRLKGELFTSNQKNTELTKKVADLTAEKKALEDQLKTAEASLEEGKGSTKALSEANEKVTKLQSLLAEYEVIEDDLANLKKYQQENKTLKAELDALKGGTPAASSVPPAPPQAVPEPTPAPAPTNPPNLKLVKPEEPPAPSEAVSKPAAQATAAEGGEKSDADLLQEFEKMLNS